MNELVTIEEGRGGDLSVFDQAVFEKMKAIHKASTAENTVKAYRSDLKYVIAWAEASGLEASLPMSEDFILRFITEHLDIDGFEGLPEHVDQQLVEAGYKAKLGGHAISTVERRVYALSHLHAAKDLPNPVRGQAVKKHLIACRRTIAKQGYRPNKKKAATRDVLDKMLAHAGSGPAGIRARALLWFGFRSGGRRRSEIADARIEDLIEVEDGYIYQMGRTKTDQEGARGKLVPVAAEAGEAMRAWLELVGDDEGPIFRKLTRYGKVLPSGIGDKTVAQVIKDCAHRAGLRDPETYGGHSLRSGFMTEGGRQNVNLFQLMDLSGHNSVDVAKGYFQAGNVMQNPGARL